MPFSRYFSQLHGQNLFDGDVLVLRDGAVTFSSGYGQAHFVKGPTNDEDTVFPIGSLTKQFTAMAIQRQIHCGGLDPDRRLTSLLPVDGLADDVTVGHLLTHRGGLAACPHGAFAAQIEDLRRGNRIDLRTSRTATRDFHYSNVGYTLLALILEQVTGRSFHEHLQETVLGPLGMVSTGHAASVYWGADGAGATGHRRRGDRRIPCPLPDMHDVLGAGDLCSNARDLGLWATALDHAPWHGLIRSGPQDGNLRTGYQCGLYREVGPGHELLWHAGALNGFRALFMRRPDLRASCIVLGNIEPMPLKMLKRDLALMLAGHACEPEIRSHPVPDTVGGGMRRDFVGGYLRAGSDEAIEIRETSSGAVLVDSKGEAYALACLGCPDAWLILDTDETITFNMRDHGGILAIYHTLEGVEVTFFRQLPGNRPRDRNAG
jgi:CubicO group peptidase (beta-lactamase class C family)